MRQNVIDRKYPFDIEEMKKSNGLIIGSNQVGKSNWALQIADLCMSNYWQVVVFDSAGTWQRESSIPHFYQVSEKSLRYVQPDSSIIYDISYLLPSYQREFIEVVLNDLWNQRIREYPRSYLLIILEECHLYMKSLRSAIAENLLRFCSVGAQTHIKIGVLGIGCDMAMIATEFLRLANQKWVFRLIKEENQRRKISRTFGLDFYKVCLDFEVGECFYCLRNENPRIHKLPLFVSKRLPQRYAEPKPQIKKREPQDLKEKILSALNGNQHYLEDEEEDELDLPLFLEEFGDDC